MLLYKAAQLALYYFTNETYYNKYESKYRILTLLSLSYATDGPKMPVISGPTIIASGSNLTLRCSAESWPQSNYTWYFGGLMVAESQEYKLASLHLNNSGNYSCSARNDITNITKMVTKEITVIGKIISLSVSYFRPLCMPLLLIKQNIF